ncbi:hypothetical protein ACLOJK_000090 [Asimina triloba]
MLSPLSEKEQRGFDILSDLKGELIRDALKKELIEHEIIATELASEVARQKEMVNQNYDALSHDLIEAANSVALLYEYLAKYDKELQFFRE